MKGIFHLSNSIPYVKFLGNLIGWMLVNAGDATLEKSSLFQRHPDASDDMLAPGLTWPLCQLTSNTKWRFIIIFCCTCNGCVYCTVPCFVEWSHTNVQAAEAGNVSLKQLMLSTEMGDPVLASRSRIFMASSLLQLGHLKAAKKIIK